MDPKSITTVITGAARGIGRALASQLVVAGGRVILADIDAAALARTVESLASNRARGIPTDITSARSVAQLAEVAGDFDVWINNAGIARHRSIPDYTESDIDLMLAVNLKGTILGSQAALRMLAAKRRGHIINLVSTAALRGVPTETVYCAAKWGVRGFTQGLREEASLYGVRVTALLPGGVDTSFWENAAPGRKLPRHDWLTADQVAEAIVALISLPDSVVPQELVLRAIKDCDFGS